MDSIDEAIMKMRKTLAVQKGLDAESEEYKATAARLAGMEMAAALAAATAEAAQQEHAQALAAAAKSS